MTRTILFGVLGAAIAASAANAHINLEIREAPVGASYKAIFKIGHGCDGSPTVKLRVKIPNGVIAVKPMPKPGWTLETVSGKYDKTYSYFHNAKLSEGVTEVIWSGGKLADAHYDEFVFQGYLAPDLKPGTMIYFPVVQECEKGIHRWIEIPAAGKPEPDEPAPGVKLLPASGHRH